MSSTESTMDKGAVVAGYDGSEEARKAVRWAAGEAAARGRRLVVAHVVGFPPVPEAVPGGGAWPRPGFLEAGQETAQRHAEAMLGDIAQECRRAWPELTVSTRLLSGRAPDELAHAAENADLLVIGSSGLTALPRLLVGSTANELLHDYHRPIVVVRTGEEPSSEGDGKVVVGVDGSETSREAIGFAYDFAARHGRALVALHVWSDLPLEAMAVTPTEHDRELIEERGKPLLDEALAGYRERYPDVPVQRVIAVDRPAHALAEQAEGAALLVVGSHGRGPLRRALLGSVSRAMVHHAPCPVAVVRHHKERDYPKSRG
ncbi:universal stress protein [Amycolatopsis japonica]|uniref:universal stress protein n=1 Tax=Amycolatopsis japonica TaxID=208439 RepID=UPI00366D7F4F